MTPTAGVPSADRSLLNDAEREVIARELCDGVPGAKPGHPQLRRDIDNALFCALRSPALRVIIHRLAAEGGPGVVKRSVL
jgi:hypothetical protein